MNHHRPHPDAQRARTSTPSGRNVVVGTLVHSVLPAMSVPDVSGQAIADLGIESLRHVAPTMTPTPSAGSPRVRDPWESTSGGDRGVIQVQSCGVTQEARPVRVFRRNAMIPQRSCLDARGGDQPGWGRPVADAGTAG